MPKIDAPELTRSAAAVASDKVYVEVPDEDLFDLVHPDIIINGEHFGPGKHYVSPILAGEIKRLVDQFRRGQVRLLQPKRDAKALGAVAREATSRGGNLADPDSF